MPTEKFSCKRVVIYAKDIERITGKGVRAAQIMLADIKKSQGKKKHHLVTIWEFCAHTGLDEKLVSSMII